MPRSRTLAPSLTYHGDLRQALVRAGLEILEQGGIAALTLREAARRISVSHAAPYHHFPDRKPCSRPSLRGFQIQTEEMELAIENAETTDRWAPILRDGVCGLRSRHLALSPDVEPRAKRFERKQGNGGVLRGGPPTFHRKDPRASGMFRERAQSISLLL
ncbi:MAG: helix-turn-helix transcriptional regulator [Fibrobacteres bacterium]|nr:helix-turn-helix transcriptional regulator [Fibrobacterota bacterium]